MSTFVIGVGRRSAGNDGVGPRVIDWLRKRTLPQGTALHVVREPSELLAFEAAQRLIVVDAVVGAPAPGQVVVLAAEALESMRAPAQGSHGISLSDALAPFRLINTYYLFTSVTRRRIEPTFETTDGARWVEHDLRYKPGPVDRAPPLVAPHQPRVDFLLWFYGLRFERMPPYVQTLLERMCADPQAVDPLFTTPLPPAPKAVRVVFYAYRFSTPRDKRERGAWWTRQQVAATREASCAALR